MSRKRTKKNPKDEIQAMKKILCDEAQNQMKVRNFTKALIGYNQVGMMKTGCEKFEEVKNLRHLRRTQKKLFAAMPMNEICYSKQHQNC